jgi:hypothetical protein
MNELQGNQPVTDRPSGWSPAVAGATSTGTEQSLIGPTVVIRGEVSAEEDLMIMGRVEGHVDHSSTVTIHARGTVAAEIKAREVLVEGTVEGNVYGTDRVQGRHRHGRGCRGHRAPLPGEDRDHGACEARNRRHGPDPIEHRIGLRFSRICKGSAAAGRRQRLC